MAEYWIVDLDDPSYPVVAHTTSLEAAQAVQGTLDPDDLLRGRYSLDMSPSDD